MKNQYFGDISDYRKYGLLRSIIGASKLRLLVAWVLTPDDGGNDGNFVSYLADPDKWSKYDCDLFNGIRTLLSRSQKRQVSLIENTQLLPEAKYFSVHVPDKASDRDLWFQSFVEQAKESDLVFLDPDNGLEVRSKPYGRKGSSKYVYWREIAALWSSGKSLLIYQHFIFENRFNFIQRMLESLRNATPGSLVEAFSTPHVVFLMALQPNHEQFHEKVVDLVQKSWQGQIHHWELTIAQQGAPANVR